MSLLARMTIELRRIPDGDDTMTHAVASIITPGTTMGARTLVQVPASGTIAEAVAEAKLREMAAEPTVPRAVAIDFFNFVITQNIKGASPREIAKQSATAIRGEFEKQTARGGSMTKPDKHNEIIDSKHVRNIIGVDMAKGLDRSGVFVATLPGEIQRIEVDGSVEFDDHVEPTGWNATPELATGEKLDRIGEMAAVLREPGETDAEMRSRILDSFRKTSGMMTHAEHPEFRWQRDPSERVGVIEETPRCLPELPEMKLGNATGSTRTKPCPDCAHTSNPGVYVGFAFTREPCQTCDGLATVTELEPKKLKTYNAEEMTLTYGGVKFKTLTPSQRVELIDESEKPVDRERMLIKPIKVQVDMVTPMRWLPMQQIDGIGED